MRSSAENSGGSAGSSALLVSVTFLNAPDCFSARPVRTRATPPLRSAGRPAVVSESMDPRHPAFLSARWLANSMALQRGAIGVDLHQAVLGRLEPQPAWREIGSCRRRGHEALRRGVERVARAPGDIHAGERLRGHDLHRSRTGLTIERHGHVDDQAQQAEQLRVVAQRAERLVKIEVRLRHRRRPVAGAPRPQEVLGLEKVQRRIRRRRRERVLRAVQLPQFRLPSFLEIDHFHMAALTEGIHRTNGRESVLDQRRDRRQFRR